MLKDLDTPLDGRHVLIVEDIVDTGLTLSYLQDTLRARGPKTLRKLQQGQRITPRLRDNQVPDPLIQGPADHRAEQLPIPVVLGFGEYKVLQIVNILHLVRNLC